MLHPPTALQSFGAKLGMIWGNYKVWQRITPRRLAIAPALGKTCMQINIGGFLTQHASSRAAQGKMDKIYRFHDNLDFRQVGPPHADASERGLVQSTQRARVKDFLRQVRP